jgi:hypothetical protein
MEEENKEEGVVDEEEETVEPDTETLADAPETLGVDVGEEVKTGENLA